MLFSSEVKETVKGVSSECFDKYEEFPLSQDKVDSDEEKIQKRDEYLTNLYKTVSRGLVHSVILDSSSVTFSTSMRSSYSQAKLEVGEKLYYSLN